MGDDIKRNVLLLGAVVTLFLTGVIGASLAGFLDLPSLWHEVAAARAPIDDPDLLWEQAQEYYQDADKDFQKRAYAKACARRVVVLNPKHSRARKMLVALFLQDKDFGEAEAQSRDVLLLVPADLTARLGLGAALRGQNKNKEARDTYRMVWDDPQANGLQKDEAQRNLQALDPAFLDMPPSYLLPTPLASPSASPTPASLPTAVVR